MEVSADLWRWMVQVGAVDRKVASHASHKVKVRAWRMHACSVMFARTHGTGPAGSPYACLPAANEPGSAA